MKEIPFSKKMARHYRLAGTMFIGISIYYAGTNGIAWEAYAAIITAACCLISYVMFTMIPYARMNGNILTIRKSMIKGIAFDLSKPISIEESPKYLLLRSVDRSFRIQKNLLAEPDYLQLKNLLLQKVAQDRSP